MAEPTQDSVSTTVRLEFEREDDGRWIAEAVDLPGVLAYGPTPRDACRAAMALAYRVLADRLDAL